MDPAVEQALAPILADLQRTNGFRFEVNASAGGTVWLLGSQGCGIGITIDESFDATWNAAHVGEAVQEYAIEVGHRAWPECPDHPGTHPLWLKEGAYTCPDSGRVHGHLGHLES